MSYIRARMQPFLLKLRNFRPTRSKINLQIAPKKFMLLLFLIPLLVCGKKKFNLRLDGVYFADTLQAEISNRVVILYADSSFTEINQRNPMTRKDSFLYSVEFRGGGAGLLPSIPKEKKIRKIKYDELISQWDSLYIDSTYRRSFMEIQNRKNKTIWGKYEIFDSLLILRSKTYSNDGLSLNIHCQEQFIIVNDSTIEMIQGLNDDYVVDENNRWAIGKEYPLPPIRYRFHAIDKPDSTFAWYKHSRRKIKF